MISITKRTIIIYIFKNRNLIINHVNFVEGKWNMKNLEIYYFVLWNETDLIKFAFIIYSRWIWIKCLSINA